MPYIVGTSKVQQNGSQFLICIPLSIKDLYSTWSDQSVLWQDSLSYGYEKDGRGNFWHVLPQYVACPLLALSGSWPHSLLWLCFRLLEGYWSLLALYGYKFACLTGRCHWTMFASLGTCCYKPMNIHQKAHPSGGSESLLFMVDLSKEHRYFCFVFFFYSVDHCHVVDVPRQINMGGSNFLIMHFNIWSNGV